MTSRPRYIENGRNPTHPVGSTHEEEMTDRERARAREREREGGRDGGPDGMSKMRRVEVRMLS